MLGLGRPSDPLTALSSYVLLLDFDWRGLEARRVIFGGRNQKDLIPSPCLACCFPSSGQSMIKAFQPKPDWVATLGPEICIIPQFRPTGLPCVFFRIGSREILTPPTLQVGISTRPSPTAVSTGGSGNTVGVAHFLRCTPVSRQHSPPP